MTAIFSFLLAARISAAVASNCEGVVHSSDPECAARKQSTHGLGMMQTKSLTKTIDFESEKSAASSQTQETSFSPMQVSHQGKAFANSSANGTHIDPHVAGEDWVQETFVPYIRGPIKLTLGHCPDSFYKSQLDDASYHVPNCNAPDGGFPGLVILPGKGGQKEKVGFWPKVFAGKGIVTMNVDGCVNGKIYQYAWTKWLVKMAIEWMRGDGKWVDQDNGQSYSVNPDDITIMGYSAGAEWVNSLYITSATVEGGADGGPEVRAKNLISLGGIRGSLRHEDGINNMDNRWPAYFAAQANDDEIMGDATESDYIRETVGKFNAKTGHAHLYYYEFGGHKPFKPSFFYEAVRFIKDPENYISPTGDPQSGKTEWNDGYLAQGAWLHFEEEGKQGKGCFKNGDGIGYITAMDAKSGDVGRLVCRNYCAMIASCTGFDLLDPYVDAPEGRVNCVLFEQKCENPQQATAEKSEWRPAYTGVRSAAFCLGKPAWSPLPGYAWHEQTNCLPRDGQSINVGSIVLEQTIESCAEMCGSNDECTGFQFGTHIKTMNKCQLKKDFDLTLCKPNDRWEVYTKVPPTE